MREYGNAQAGLHRMTLHRIIRALGPALLAGTLAPAHADGDAASGRQLYALRCSACHSVEYNGVGPSHKNLAGRTAGTFPGFAYSRALKESGVVWDEKTLNRWLADPEKLIPGQKMFFLIPDAKERADIVAYLLATTRPQPPNPNRKPGD
jgi:cytochrome c